MKELLAAIVAYAGEPEQQRVDVYNAATAALRLLVADLVDAPCLAPQLVRAEALEANDYNPNNVATPEMTLLEQSIRCDGVTMPVVTFRDVDRGRWIVIDGYHRRVVIVDRLESRWVPCSEISRPLADRMASTVRHNRARGKHQVDLMAGIVHGLMEQGWTDERIAEHIGMTTEELLRLKQVVGVAPLLAGSEYSQSWGAVDDPAD